MPTYSRRRSSARASGSPSASASRLRRCGSVPSSSPHRNTTGNSRPLALCRVSRAGASTPSSRTSTSLTRATWVRNSARSECS